MEKIIEESKQGESLILENKPENTKTIYRKLWLCDEFFGQRN
jgi:tRNA-2-methylthio-N6-dimethylallyladenosine synthase